MGQGIKYGRLVTDTDFRTGTEFGGLDNIIQPPPHDPATSPVDTLRQIYQTNPAGNWPAGRNLDNQPVPQTEQVRP